MIGTTMIVGTHATCDVRVDDPYVSTRHCAVRREPDGTFWVWDLGSLNGTFVQRNGVRTRVNGPPGMRILPGDTLWLSSRTSIPWTTDRDKGDAT